MGTAYRSSQAALDLIEIWDHIAKDDPGAADRLLDSIDEACAMLASHPLAGPSREDLAPGLRFYPVRNYLVFYILSDDGITVARVIHGARDYAFEFSSAGSPHPLPRK